MSDNDGWGSIPAGYKPPVRSQQAAERHQDVRLARHARSLHAEAYVRGGDLYRPGYKGVRDPDRHFFGASFDHSKASDDLKAWHADYQPKPLRHDMRASAA